MTISLIWFRRDLRLEDNAALYHALKAPYPVLPVFIFDRNILKQLDDRYDRRISFICQALQDMQDVLAGYGSSLAIRHDTPEAAFRYWLGKYQVAAVYTNHDYEPYAVQRDAAVKALLEKEGVAFYSYKDQVVFEKDEVVKEDGKPYTVFTPYARKWKDKISAFYTKPYPVKQYSGRLFPREPASVPAPEDLGFVRFAGAFPSKEMADGLISGYDRTRDFPALENGTSGMGVHLRFGTVSIRALAARALHKNTAYLNELIWRDFYQMILWHFPQVAQGRAFKPAYDRIPWRNNEDEFARWCEGNTGYPIVDAGMRQLNETGYMHNRVRMITASFLTRHLLIDWRWGEAYFAQKLLDYDLAANNGGWQWAAGSGCDAAPYFRVFNPYLQAQKFDPKQQYIRKWVPEFETTQYPQPIVEHEAARRRALEVYGNALKQR